jgi:hypothetical protein
MTESPWIDSASNNDPHQTGSIHSATWAAWIHLRNYSELLGFQWGFNARDLRQDALERNLQFVKSICTFRPIEQGWRRTFIIRMYKSADILKFVLIVRNVGESLESACMEAYKSWLEIRSTYPYDYVLTPLSKDEFGKNIPQDLSIECVGYNFVTVFYPCTRFSFSKSDIKNDNPIISVGSWSSSDTTPELIWRMLDNTLKPIALEILIQPTIIQIDEWQAFGTLKDILQKQLVDKGSVNPSIKEWFDAWSNRIYSLSQPYIVQLRMFSSAPIPTYVEQIIGSALTYSPSPISSYETLQPAPEQIAYWQKGIENHDFIDCGTLLSTLPRLPYLATLPEVARVFRAPFLPKGGIPDLNIDIAKKNSL